MKIRQATRPIYYERPTLKVAWWTEYPRSTTGRAFRHVAKLNFRNMVRAMDDFIASVYLGIRTGGWKTKVK